MTGVAMHTLANLSADGKILKSPRCGHCGNAGRVVLDQLQNGYEVAAPCPGCQLGQLIDLKAADGHPSETYWARHVVALATWQGGMNLTWRPCKPCSQRLEERVLIPPGDCSMCKRIASGNVDKASDKARQLLAGLTRTVERGMPQNDRAVRERAAEGFNA